MNDSGRVRRLLIIIAVVAVASLLVWHGVAGSHRDRADTAGGYQGADLATEAAAAPTTTPTPTADSTAPGSETNAPSEVLAVARAYAMAYTGSSSTDGVVDSGQAKKALDQVRPLVDEQAKRDKAAGTYWNVTSASDGEDVQVGKNPGSYAVSEWMIGWSDTAQRDSLPSGVDTTKQNPAATHYLLLVEKVDGKWTVTEAYTGSAADFD